MKVEYELQITMELALQSKIESIGIQYVMVSLILLVALHQQDFYWTLSMGMDCKTFQHGIISPGQAEWMLWNQRWALSPAVFLRVQHGRGISAMQWQATRTTKLPLPWGLSPTPASTTTFPA